MVNSATHRYSLTHELIEADLVRKVICTAARGHFKDPSPFETRWMAGKIELEMVPQGTFTERIRAGGAGIPAFYTPVGFGTELTKDKEVRRFGERDYVLEPAITGDLALVRADIADRTGNLIFRYAQMNFGPVMATAAKLAVAEVRAVSRRSAAARARAAARHLCRPRGAGHERAQSICRSRGAPPRTFWTARWSISASACRCTAPTICGPSST